MVNSQTQIRNFQFTFRNASIITAALLLAVGFVLYVWMEVATHSMFYPLAATGAFAAFFDLPALLLLWRAPLRVKFAFISTFLLLILVVRNVEWNSRKPFLRALDAVQVGMTTEQVDAAMRGFVRVLQTGISDYGTVNFRHTDEGWGNADVGVVTFRNARVVRVEFLGD
ncbi:MAG: hypothetical protein EYC68_20290 [Chloroflexota bacterium]|nr:MAG: hypothetical protein EYC68_20290 [Chloroflexota bacterium]